MSWRHKIFSTRTANLLARFGIFTMSDLANIDLEKFSKMKNVGQDTIKEVKNYLETLNKN